MARVHAVVDGVAGIPPRPSYVWGSRVTPLAWLAFHGIMVARLVSPLQWVKFLYRRPGRARLTHNRRRDFPAALTEWYFLVLAAALGCLVVVGPPRAGWLSVVVVAVCWVLAMEGATWIVYYLFLRPFIEGRFSAYHPAEYLLQFPLVCLVQCLALASALSVPPVRILDALRGAGELPGALGVALGLLGIVYTGGALSVLINALPTIQARGADMLAIIGAGEVSRDRILPALRSRGRTPAELVVLDTADAEIPGYAVKRRDQDGIVAELHRLRVPAIVASPTGTHLDYARILAAQGVPFAVEKPLCSGASELAALRANDDIMRNGFALSYYVLEKALPLTLLMTAREQYLPYLAATGTRLTAARIREIRDGLGRALSVDVRLLEGNERSPRGTSRAWTEQPESGITALVETAIHPLHLISLIVRGRVDEFAVDELELGRYRPRAEFVQDTLGHGIAPTRLRLRGRVGAVSASVHVGKHIPGPSTERALVARFERGHVEVDFDARRARVMDLAGDTIVDLQVDPALPPYAVQLALFDEFVNHGWQGERFDELDTQLAALGMWGSLVEAAGSAPVEFYGDELDLTAERVTAAPAA